MLDTQVFSRGGCEVSVVPGMFWEGTWRTSGLSAASVRRRMVRRCSGPRLGGDFLSFVCVFELLQVASRYAAVAGRIVSNTVASRAEGHLTSGRDRSSLHRA